MHGFAASARAVCAERQVDITLALAALRPRLSAHIWLTFLTMGLMSQKHTVTYWVTAPTNYKSLHVLPTLSARLPLRAARICTGLDQEVVSSPLRLQNLNARSPWATMTMYRYVGAI